MTKWLFAAALMLMVFPCSGTAQSKASLVGTWRLVSFTSTNDKGEVENAYGPNPTGFLTYTADGRVSVILASSGRKPLSIPPTPAEETEAFSTLTAYAGSYTFNGDKVIHHIEVCLVQNIVNTDQVRFVKLQGDRLIFRGGWLVNGVMYQPNNELVWERMRPKISDK